MSSCSRRLIPSARKSTLRVWTAAWCVLLALAHGAAVASPATYAIDPVHTRVLFAISHAGFSNALGTVSGSTGTVVFDPGTWTGARVEVSVPVARLDLGDGKWNTAALANNLLDGKDHPVATFVSTRIEPVDATHAAIFGTLTLHGVAKEVKLDATLNAAKRHPMPPFRRTVGFSATTTLSRKDFAITAWPSVIGDAVELRIELEATRSGGAGDASSGAPSPASNGGAAPDVSRPDAPTPTPAMPAPATADAPAGPVPPATEPAITP